MGARVGGLRGIMAILPLAPRGVRQRRQVGSIADNCPSDLPPALPRAFVAAKGSVQSLGRLVEWVIGGGGSVGAAIGNAAMASTTADYRAEPMAALLIVPRRIPRPRSHRRGTRIPKFPEEPGRTGSLSARVSRDLEPRVQRELLHHVANVALDGVCRDLEPLSDFLVAQPLTNQCDHLALARCHPHILESALRFAATGRVHDL